jgi:hypothetical protein
MNRIVAVKNYGFEWYTTYGLTESQAAAAMVRHGIDWVAVQNLRDPLPSTAVQQITPPPAYDDRRFRDALHERGIRVFEATAVFFRPEAYRVHPDLRPVDATGATMEPFGWYVGLCPSSPAYLAERAAVVGRGCGLLATPRHLPRLHPFPRILGALDARDEAPGDP